MLTASQTHRRILPAMSTPRITLHMGTLLNHGGGAHRVTYNGNFSQASIYVYYRSWGPRNPRLVGVERLLLTPKTIREVERCLLLVAKGRAEMKPELWAVSKTARSLRLLTRFVESGHEVIASHVLTMLGGPMEQMESWVRRVATNADPAG